MCLTVCAVLRCKHMQQMATIGSDFTVATTKFNPASEKQLRQTLSQ